MRHRAIDREEAIMAEDAAKVAPHVYKVLFENEQVRLLEVIMQPGDSSEMHSHPDYFFYLLSSGGKVIGHCERSMVVHEPIAFWENWSKQRFDKSGSYALEGALVPVEIDLDRQTGTYEEPNVWVAYAA